MSTYVGIADVPLGLLAYVRHLLLLGFKRKMALLVAINGFLRVAYGIAWRNLLVPTRCHAPLLATISLLTIIGTLADQLDEAEHSNSPSPPPFRIPEVNSSCPKSGAMLGMLLAHFSQVVVQALKKRLRSTTL